MSFLQSLVEANEIKRPNLTVIQGDPGSGKTTLAGTFPKPILAVNIGKDNGVDVLGKYGKDVLSNKVGTSSYKELMLALREIKDTRPDFKTIIVDPITSVQAQLERAIKEAKGKNLNFDEWGEIADLMNKLFELCEELADFYEVVLICHTKKREVRDGATGETTDKIFPEMTESTAKRMLKNARNSWYVTPETFEDEDGNKKIVRKTYIGGHPLLTTKTTLSDGSTDNMVFVDFTYDKYLEIKNEQEAKPEVEKKATKKLKQIAAQETDNIDATDLFA